VLHNPDGNPYRRTFRASHADREKCAAVRQAETHQSQKGSTPYMIVVVEGPSTFGKTTRSPATLPGGCYADLLMSSWVTHRATFSGYGAGNPTTMCGKPASMASAIASRVLLGWS
jgi:hypothetical protein